MTRQKFVKSLFRPLAWSLIAILVFNFNLLNLDFSMYVNADNTATSVTVGNSLPSFTVDPVETVASHNGTGTGDTAGNPTNEGTTLTFQATATDGNSDDWDLVVCKTAGTTGTDCDGGAGDRWCVSGSAVASASANTCTYDTTSGDVESNAWFAYACDSTGCGSVDQGTGNSGTPFYVNHDSTFTAYSDDSGKNPGETVTFTATAADPDSDGGQDTITLFVCKTASFTSGSCDGGEWCHTATGQAANPTCTYAIPSVYPDQTHTAYGYIIDNHGLVSSGASQGTDASMIVNNTAPTLTAGNITLKDTDGSGDLTLTVEEGETEAFYVEFIVTDSNSCETSIAGDEISSAILNVYRSSVTSALCDADGEDDDNDCYANAHSGTNGSCVQDVAVDSCTGDTDSTVGWKCTFPLKYHADPTDVGSQFPDDTWKVSINVTDDDAATSGLTEGTTGLEMIQFSMYDVDNGSSTLSFGTLGVGAESADSTTTIEATGNVGLDMNLNSNGTDMCDNYPTCDGETMATTQQHYYATDVAWASMTALSSSSTEMELNVVKSTSGTPASADIHWKIKIPSDQAAAAYAGQNVLAGITGESGSW